MAGALRHVQGDVEDAVGRDHGSAQDGAIGGPHRDRGAGFAASADHTAFGIQDGVGRCRRRSDVGCVEHHVGRGIAGRIGLAQRQGLAIELRCAQRQAEGAIVGDLGATEQTTIGGTCGDGGTGLTGTGDGTAIGAQLQVSERGRRGHIGRDQGRGR